MREEHSDLLMAHARSGMVVGINRAADREGKNARNLDAEMRKRRLAKNALLAVRRHTLNTSSWHMVFGSYLRVPSIVRVFVRRTG